ncbi:MAG: hypothetical protein ABI091_05360 [Ferruginibacter sp.]
MEITNRSKIINLQTAAICYIIAGIGFFLFSYPFWFLNAVDHKPMGHMVTPFLFLRDDIMGVIMTEWYQPVTSIALFIGAYCFWKTGEPTGSGPKKKFLFLSMAGGISYFIGIAFMFPFTPLGALLSASGMLAVGIVCLKAGIWTGWKRFTPLIAGLFPFIFMYPLLIITKHRPAFIIGFWGIPWMLLGIAAWQRSKEIISKK